LKEKKNEQTTNYMLQHLEKCLCNIVLFKTKDMVTTNILISLLGVLKLYCPALNNPDTSRELF
jgi:hypothetical protein